jgi:GntR family transcriptional regulator
MLFSFTVQSAERLGTRAASPGKAPFRSGHEIFQVPAAAEFDGPRLRLRCAECPLSVDNGQMAAALEIDLQSPVPVYRQIADGIRAKLVSAEVQPGQQLPTVRQLAADLGLHRNTVAQAYRILADEGWLDLGRRRGATVQDRRQPRNDPAASQKFRQRLEQVWAEALASGVPPADLRAVLLTLARRSRT